LAVLLHFILEPLKKVKYQAEAILNNKFIIQEEQPYTTELRDVSNAMNSMVRRVKEIFKQATEVAKRNKELQYNDPVTKLFNRRYLMIKLPELINLEGRTNGGSIILLALNGAQHLNQILGRQKADAFFLELAKNLKSICTIHDENVISRVNGTEFILVLPNAHTSETQHIAQQINRNFDNLLQSNTISNTQASISMGIYRYRSHISVADLLTRVDTALLKAKNSERDNIYVYEEEYEEMPLTKTQWRALFEESIKNNSFELEFFVVKDTQTKKLIHKNLSFHILTQDKKSYCYNEFIAPAITLGMTSELYLGVLKNLFVNYKSQLNAINYSLKLPKEFLEDENSFDKLSILFNKYAKKIDFHLCFEVADSFAIHKTATVLGYVDLFKKHGFNIGINSYTGESSDFSYLKEINPKFIKADTQFLLDQSEDAINTLRVITNSLDIFIVATSVQTQDEIEMLSKYKIYKAQGPIIETI
jgi:diguanylate cyclase (GGDEF)-like protein